MIDWIKGRISERTTWDGGVVIGMSILILIASPIIKWVAYAGLIYGAWALITKED
tara:strand:+ start:625 stop:789 length:165 start_codon:yes stop_codon:yes gene_type:complete